MKIIITAGGTTEKIDDVRTITNSSTGKLGAKIADRFFSAENVSIDHIYYICGHNAAAPRSDRVSIIRIGSVSELVSQIKEILAAEKIDVFIHSMA
ncbi:MAG: DNA/pantothenate metabolism flavoprotein domain protein, partial [Eubacterium sp.]|nr:DNA/pantothenate metabolism flavoprotein domain protein [Eubacterium sp.]